MSLSIFSRGLCVFSRNLPSMSVSLTLSFPLFQKAVPLLGSDKVVPYYGQFEGWEDAKEFPQGISTNDDAYNVPQSELLRFVWERNRIQQLTFLENYDELLDNDNLLLKHCLKYLPYYDRRGLGKNFFLHFRLFLEFST